MIVKSKIQTMFQPTVLRISLTTIVYTEVGKKNICDYSFYEEIGRV